MDSQSLASGITSVSHPKMAINSAILCVPVVVAVDVNERKLSRKYRIKRVRENAQKATL